MAAAKLHCTFVLLLYLQGNYAQQGLSNNQNVGVNNVIGFPQQALQRTNTPNNINQMPNGGLNMNLPQQANLPQGNIQQGNIQQPIGVDIQGNLQQSLSLQGNLQPQGGSGSLANMQFTKQGLVQLPPGLVGNPLKSQTVSAQLNNCARQNAQTTQPQNMCPITNGPTSQTQNPPFSSNSLAELAALKGHSSLLSLFAPQNNVQSQQNVQMGVANFNPAQNQLTDAQKQYLVRALQSQPSGQNQPSLNFAQTQVKVASANNQPMITVQGTPVSAPQQAQAIVTPVSQPAYITVQAQPLTSYLQNQAPQVAEEPSIMSLILSELQPTEPPYSVYPAYPIQKTQSKSNLKSLIPLIINLLKEKNNCGCRNCGCPSNGCNNNSIPEPTIFGGYSIQKDYSKGVEETPTTPSPVEEVKTKSNKKDKKNDKKNVVNVDSEEGSEENDSEYVDDSEGD